MTTKAMEEKKFHSMLMRKNEVVEINFHEYFDLILQTQIYIQTIRVNNNDM